MVLFVMTQGAAVKFTGLSLDGQPLGSIDVISAKRQWGSLTSEFTAGATGRPVLPVSTILAGKLNGRWQQNLPRDAYDLAVALQHAPRDVGRAFDTVNPREFGTYAHLLEQTPWPPPAPEEVILDPTDDWALRNAADIVVAAIDRHADGQPVRLPAVVSGAEYER